MFRQRLENSDANEDGAQMMVCSAAAARYMDSTSLASSSAADAASTSPIFGWQQQQQNVEVQSAQRLESGHGRCDQRGTKRSRERLESNDEYSTIEASVQTTFVTHSPGRRKIETVRGINKGKQELEGASGILLNTAELAAVTDRVTQTVSRKDAYIRQLQEEVRTLEHALQTREAEMARHTALLQDPNSSQCLENFEDA